MSPDFAKYPWNWGQMTPNWEPLELHIKKKILIKEDNLE